MPNKSYAVIIQIDINKIDCPGVWLCPKGKAFLKLCLFGLADLTKDVDPFFPLVIRERFIFEKNFKEVSSVYELHDKIGRSVISIELLQCPVGSPGCVKLAIFNSLLSDLLHPYSSCFAKPPDTSGIELLFTACEIFPGIIAPKADVSLKVVVSDSSGDGGKPSVRRMPLKTRKGDSKRQQAVCHSKNGLNCGCFSHDYSKPQQGSGEGENGIIPEPKMFAGRGVAYRSSTDTRPRTSQFYPKPPPRLTTDFSRHQGEHHKSKSQKPIQRFLGGQKKSRSESMQQQPEYEKEPNMDWAKINFGLAVGPGEYNKDENDQNALFSGGWEYVWDGNKANSTKPPNKRPTIFSSRRAEYAKINKNKGLLEEPVSEGESMYGDEAIRRELDECNKLLKRYTPDDVRDDPKLKSKYDDCVKHIERLRKSADRSHSSDVSSGEEVLQSVAPKRPAVVPCHGKCCKCKVEDMEPTRNPYLKRKQKFVRNGGKLTTTAEDAIWSPQKKWEKEKGSEVRRKKERFWERERVIHGQEQNLDGSQSDESSETESLDDTGLWRLERDRRREEERVSQREARDRFRKLQQKQPSNKDVDEMPNGYIAKNDQPPETPKRVPLQDKRRVFSPEKHLKPSAELPKPLLPSARTLNPSLMPHIENRQDQILPGPSIKTKPTINRPPKNPASVKPPSDPIRASSPKENDPDDGDSLGEDCDCDLCEQYQELYNPSSHPCPRFRKTVKKDGRKTSINNARTGAKKLIASRKNGNGRVKKPKQKIGECEFASCDGPIDTETIEEMNAIRKFYYGK